MHQVPLGIVRQHRARASCRARIDNAFRQLFETVQVREEEGRPVMFAHTPVVSPSGRVRAGDMPAGLSVSEVQGVIDRFKARLLGPPAGRIPVQVFATQDEAFGPGSIDRYGRIKGTYLPATGRIVLIGAHLRNTRDAETVLRHEAVGHFGLNLLSPADKRAFLERVAEASGRSRYLRRVRDEVLRAEGQGADPLLVAEEVFARVAESGRSNLGAAWDNLLMWLRDKLREFGLLRGAVGPVEMRAFAADIARGIRLGTAQRTFPATDQVQFSGRGPDARLEALLAQYANVEGAPSAVEPAEAVRQYRDVGRRYADVLRAFDEGRAPLPSPKPGEASNLNREHRATSRNRDQSVRPSARMASRTAGRAAMRSR